MVKSPAYYRHRGIPKLKAALQTQLTQDIKKNLVGAGKVAITADRWNPVVGDVYKGYILHYLTTALKLMKVMATVRKFEEEKASGLAIARAMDNLSATGSSEK